MNRIYKYALYSFIYFLSSLVFIVVDEMLVYLSLLGSCICSAYTAHILLKDYDLKNMKKRETS